MGGAIVMLFVVSLVGVARAFGEATQDLIRFCSSMFPR
jgi:hypothetical protein